MQTMAVGWEIYGLTNDPLSLAWVGLAEVLPVILLSLIAGQVADRFNRRTVIAISVFVVGVASVGLAINSAYFENVPGALWVALLDRYGSRLPTARESFVYANACAS